MQKKNVVFLLCDQLQRYATENSGICQMPNLQKLNQDSVSFINAHTANAVCSPSRASLMTARLPHNHGMVDCTHTVPKYRSDYDENLDTLSRRLHGEGYAMAYYGKWHIERTYQLERYGFDEFETEIDLPSFERSPVSRLVVHTEGYHDKVICGTYEEREEKTEEAYLYEKAIDFIRRKKNEGSFCVFISTYAPHDPYTVPQDIYHMYDGIEIPLPESYPDNMLDKPAVYRRLKEVWNDFDMEDAKEILRCYYSYCTLIDKQIGRLTDYLKKEKLYDDTLIVFTSDHGDLMGAHGLFCKGIPCFEETYSIPLSMKLPGNVLSGMRNEAYVNTYDIAPTMLDILGLKALENPVDGISMLPYLYGKDTKDTCCFAEFEGQRYAYTQRIVWKDGLKYVFNTFDYDELYNLKEDPYELVNLSAAAEYQDKKQDLTALMWRRICESEDNTMSDAQYVMLRFAPVGPRTENRLSSFEIFNKTF